MPRRFKVSPIYSNKFTKEMLAEFESVFGLVCGEELDKMEDVKLSLALQALGLDVSSTFYHDLLDAKSSFIDFDRFLSIVSICIQNSSWLRAELRESFAIFDRDGDGSLDKNELKRVFTKLGENLTEKELEDQIKEYDVDGDGLVGFDEWIDMENNTRGADFIFDT